MERTAQQLIFPHRQRTSEANKLGAVKPAFKVALVAKARGSLNKLLVPYDIFFFIALGRTKEQACVLFKHCVDSDGLSESTLQKWIQRECIVWPPANYSPQAQQEFFDKTCAKMKESDQWRARANRLRVRLMRLWLEGKISEREAAVAEGLISEALGLCG